MADSQPQSTDQGFLPGLLGNVGGWFGSYDPQAAYGGLLSDPATKRAFQVRELGAAAQAMAQASMPVPYKGGMPWGSFLGSAGGAAATAGDSLIKARLEQAQADLAQQQGLLAHANVQGLAMNNSLYPVALGLDGKGGTGTGTDGKKLTGPAAIIAGQGGGKAISSTTADTSLPPEARALLDTIAGPESNGAYNVRWGGPSGDKTFDSYAAHPNIPEPGPQGDSTAAGRYQIVNKTWKPLQAKYGFGDFTPVTQDQAGWHLAADTYKEQTGRDLLTDLQAGKTDQVASALHGQWSTLNMGSYGKNLGKYQGGSGASPQTASTGDQPAAPSATPPAADLGPQNASGGAYSVPPPPGPPPKPGEYTTPVRAGNVPLPPAAPPGGLLKLPDPTSAAPPQLATPPAAGAPGPVTGLLGQQPAQQVAAADAPQLSPAAAAILHGINRQQAGGGLLASGSVAGDNAVPSGEPPAVAQAGPPHTGAAGAAELAGLLAQKPPPQAPAAGPVPPAAAPAPAPAPAGPMPPAPGGAPPPGVAPPMPPPAPPQMPPPPVSSGPIAGAPTDRQVAAASIIAHNNIMMGKAVPPDIAAILNYKYAGPTAAATAAATAPITQANAAYEAQVKAQYDLWVKQSAPRDIRKGGISEDPITHQTLINPDTVRRTDPDTGNQYDYYSYPSLTGGAPTLVPIGLAVLGPGAVKTLKNTAGAQPITVGNQVTGTGPGYTQPLKTADGSFLPPASSAAPITGSKDYLDTRSKQFADTENAWGKSVGAAQEAIQRTQAIMTAMKLYHTGAFATETSDLVAALKAAHVDLGNKVNDPAQAQIILKDAFGQALSGMEATGLSKWTQAELFGQLKNLANPDLQPTANREIGAQTIGTLQWEQQMQKDFGRYKQFSPGVNDPTDFQRRWVEANPLQPFIDKARAQIGLLKGESEIAPPPTGARHSVWNPQTKRLEPVGAPQ